MAGKGLRWLILLIMSVQYLLVYFHRVCPAIVAPDLVKSFVINNVALGVLASVYFYAYAAMQVPMGMLADTWGAKKTVLLFGCLASAGAIAFGLSPTFGMAMGARLLVGLGVSAVFVCSIKLFSNWFSPMEFGRVSGVFAAFGGIGWLVATAPLAFLAETCGWRAAFVIIGVIGVGVMVLSWLWIVERPGEKHVPGADNLARSGSPAGHSLRNAFTMVLRSRPFWILATWTFCTNVIQFAFLGLWAGPYLMDVYHLSRPATGKVLSMVAVGIIVGAPLFGYLSDRVLTSRKKVLVASAIVLALSLGVLLANHGTLSYPGLYAVFFFLGTTTGGIGPIGYTASKELFPNEMAGTSVGSYNLFAFLGGVLLQPVSGAVLDRAAMWAPCRAAAYVPVVWIFFTASLIALVCASFSRETLRV